MGVSTFGNQMYGSVSIRYVLQAKLKVFHVLGAYHNTWNSLGLISELEGFPASVLHARGDLPEKDFAMFYKRIGRIPHRGNEIPGAQIRYVLQANLRLLTRSADLQKLQIR